MSFPSLHRQSLQNKQCFRDQYMHACLLRATVFRDLGGAGKPQLVLNYIQ